jgi:two-component system, chemotaxis family, sensor kinase CheA
VPDATKPIEDVKKAVGNSPPPVGGTGPVAPAPDGGSGSGGDGSGGSGPAGNRAGEGIGSSHGISHHCPGEGMLGGGSGGGGGGILSAAPAGAIGGQPTGEGVLGTAAGGESGGPVGAFADVAAYAGPIVLAVFALGALLLLVGLAGGLRALQGRLRSG